MVRTKMLIHCFITIFILNGFFFTIDVLFPEAVLAATYYVDPTAQKDLGDGSVSNPKKYITSGLQLMKSGDTLILKDGNYQGQKNMIGDEASPQVWPPTGTVESPTVIRAEHVGSAIVDGEYNYTSFSAVNKSGTLDYIHIDGIHFRRGKNGVFNIKGTHNKVTNCGFEDGMPASSGAEAPIAYIAGGSSYSLIEDCWVWGRGRYGFYTSSTAGGTNHIIFRRVVVRLDDSPAKRMTAGLKFYKGQNNAMQNCIVVDSRISATAGEPAAFGQGGGSSFAEPDHIYNGVIALNNPQMKGFVPEDGTMINTVSNSIFWGNSDGVFTVSAFTPPFTLNLSSLTIGDNQGYAVRSNSNYSGLTVKLDNSLLHVPKGGTAFSDSLHITNTDIYLPETGTNGGKSGAYNVIGRAAFKKGLKYLPRIESDSALAVAGIGANIIYQIGETGTLFGEPGWNRTTAMPLWPLAHELKWASKMKVYSSSGPGGNRGFAAVQSTTPLTSYLWGRLGNIIPPFNLAVVPGTRQVKLSWDANIADADISGYKVYVGTSSGKYDAAGFAGGKKVGNVTSTIISGLRNGTVYYFAVTTLDKNGGESGLSYEKLIRL